MKNIVKIAVLLLLALLIVSCKGEKMKETQVHYDSLQDVPASAWKKLGEKKIYFGHQSVGFNIIDGIQDVMKENPDIKLKIIEVSKPLNLEKGCFAHGKVGSNTDHASKTDAFKELVESNKGERLDIAFFKFCYVDVNSSTDINSMFEKYKKTMSDLENRYPDTTFVYFTIPLETVTKTWKTWIKKLVGKKDMWEYDDVVRKNEFNNLLRKEYDGKKPFFDLAELEATFPDGKKAQFKKGDVQYNMLVPEYTEDDGHLNKLGRKVVAENLLLFLVEL